MDYFYNSKWSLKSRSADKRLPEKLKFNIGGLSSRADFFEWKLDAEGGTQIDKLSGTLGLSNVSAIGRDIIWGAGTINSEFVMKEGLLTFRSVLKQFKLSSNSMN